MGILGKKSKIASGFELRNDKLWKLGTNKIQGLQSQRFRQRTSKWKSSSIIKSA